MKEIFKKVCNYLHLRRAGVGPYTARLLVKSKYDDLPHLYDSEDPEFEQLMRELNGSDEEPPEEGDH